MWKPKLAIIPGGSTAQPSAISGRQDLAAFRATTLEHLATGLGLHASAKPVSPLALEYAGLECSFHFNWFLVQEKRGAILMNSVGLVNFVLCSVFLSSTREHDR